MKIFVAIVLVDVMTSCLFADPLHVQSDGTLGDKRKMKDIGAVDFWGLLGQSKLLFIKMRMFIIML